MTDDQPTTRSLSASIIIPAFNEEATIALLLSELTGSTTTAINLQIIVVCNGCSDNTSVVANSFAPAIRVVELAHGSKTNALNVGDDLAIHGTRIYLDADVHISIQGIAKLIEKLDQGGLLAVSATPYYDTKDSSWAVQAFYQTWQELPFRQSSHTLSGAGVFALSELGRAAFGCFPDVLNDDSYVDRLFESKEKSRVDQVRTKVTAPKTWRSLVLIKSRSYLGNRQLNLLGFPAQTHRHQQLALIRLLFSRHAPEALSYTITQLAARLHAIALQPFQSVRWQRDESSRRREG